jgi:hypothetical protein
MAGPLLGLSLLAGGAGTKVAGLNLLKGAGQAALTAAPYIPSLMQGLGGDPLAGAASAGATKLAGKYGKTAQVLTGLGAPMVMPALLGGVGQAAQAVAGGVGDLVTGGQQAQRERGESATRTGLGEGKSVGDMDVDETIDFLRKAGMNQVEIAEALSPVVNQDRDRQMQRQMQLNQQLGQLTGALNQQRYMAQLAGGAQAQAGETTRQMLTAENPYAASVFRYGG